jgi:hypothetical protein
MLQFMQHFVSSYQQPMRFSRPPRPSFLQQRRGVTPNVKLRCKLPATKWSWLYTYNGSDNNSCALSNSKLKSKFNFSSFSKLVASFFSESRATRKDKVWGNLLCRKSWRGRSTLHCFSNNYRTHQTTIMYKSYVSELFYCMIDKGRVFPSKW